MSVFPIELFKLAHYLPGVNHLLCHDGTDQSRLDQRPVQNQPVVTFYTLEEQLQCLRDLSLVDRGDGDPLLLRR